MNDQPEIDPRLIRRRELIAALYQQPVRECAIINDNVFRWDFGYALTPVGCGYVGCAVGQAALLWPELHLVEKGGVRIDKMVRAVGLNHAQVLDIFLYARTYGKHLKEDVTPQMVAAKLEELGNEIYSIA